MDAGTLLAVVSLSFQIFGGCVQGFTLISAAQGFGRDAHLLQTLLNFQEYRLVQWAEKIGLVGPYASIDPRLNIPLASRLLAELRSLLQKDKLRERYNLDLQFHKPLRLNTGLGSDDANFALRSHKVLGQLVSDETRDAILTKAGLLDTHNSLPKRLWWATVDKGRFKSFVNDVTSIVENLWCLLDSMQQHEAALKSDEILSRMVSMSSEITELREFQLQIVSSTNSIATNFIAAAAGLKAMRLELEDDNLPESEALVNSSITNLTQVDAQPQSTKIITQLDASNISNHVPRLDDSSRSLAMIGQTPVYIETISIPLGLRKKLRHRVETLATLLNAPKDPYFMTLHCCGYYPTPGGYDLVFSLPESLIASITNDPDPSPAPILPTSLLTLLRSSKHQPSVTDRLALSLCVCRTLLGYHMAGWLHKDLRSENIIFFTRAPIVADPSATLSSRSTTSLADLSQGYLTHFTFARADSPTEISTYPSAAPHRDIYRHPDALGDEPSTSFAAYMDIYALVMILIEISEWRSLKALCKKHVDLEKPDVAASIGLDRIATVGDWIVKDKVVGGSVSFRMGNVFANVVRRLWDEARTRTGASGGERVDHGEEDVSHAHHDSSGRSSTVEVLRSCVRDLEKCKI